jgi:hypothetical protein
MSGEGGSGGVHGQRGPSPHGWIGRALACDVCFCGRTLASTGAREVGLNASVETHALARAGIGTHPSSEVSDKSAVLDQGTKRKRMDDFVSNMIKRKVKWNKCSPVSEKKKGAFFTS